MQECTDTDIFTTRKFRYDIGDKVILRIGDIEYSENVKNLDGMSFFIKDTTWLRRGNDIEPFYLIDRYGYLLAVNEGCLEDYVTSDDISDDQLEEEYLRATKSDEEIYADDIFSLIGWDTHYD